VTKRRFSVEQITSVLKQVAQGAGRRRVLPSRADLLPLEESYGVMLPSEAHEQKRWREEIRTPGGVSVWGGVPEGDHTRRGGHGRNPLLPACSTCVSVSWEP
jgi:hypothetical protein